MTPAPEITQEAARAMLAALKGVIPYMKHVEEALLVGDEGCHWPVEEVRAAIVLADPPAPPLTPELLAALREEHAEWCAYNRKALYPSRRRLLDAIERAGILEPPPPAPHNEPSGKDYDAWWFA